MDYGKEKSGNILGYVTHDIIDKFGRLLLAEGSPLTHKIAQKLEKREVPFRVSKEPPGYNPANHAGESFQFTTVLKVPGKLDEKFNKLDSAAIAKAASYMNFILRQVQKDFFLNNTIKVLAQNHKATYSHSINVSLIAVAIAQKLKYSRRTLREIALGALYHDIGKILLPKTVLDDITGVREGQTVFYQQHTILGSDMLAADKLPQAVCQVARQHHEKYNGSGYPLGISGNEISLNAAIVTVADVFDRTTSAIFTQNVFSPEVALNQILATRDSDYHPEVVDRFLELFRKDTSIKVCPLAKLD